MYDVVCLDLGLPADGDGLELVRRLGNDPELHRPRRVLVVTARDAVSDRVDGLDAGADDYLVKPFHFNELTARLRALGRRVTSRARRCGPATRCSIWPPHRAWRSGVPLASTPREYLLLRYFMHHPGTTLSAEELAGTCLGRPREPIHRIGPGHSEPAAP